LRSFHRTLNSSRLFCSAPLRSVCSLVALTDGVVLLPHCLLLLLILSSCVCLVCVFVQLENRLDEAEKIAKQSVSELDALKQQLEEERAARAAAESQVASLTAEVAAAKEGAGSAAATLEASLRAETAAAEEKAVGLAAQNTQLQEQLEAAQGQVAELGSEQKAANAAHDEQLQAAEAAHAEALQ
jgi:DNA repair exonuclease SbcCD ATPase subunit